MTLDISFSEDHSRVPNGRTAANPAVVRWFVRSLITQDPGEKKGARLTERELGGTMPAFSIC